MSDASIRVCLSACPPGEVFNRCGTACEETCSEKFPICTAQCVEGCFCPPSFVRAPNGECIHPKWCPAVATTTPTTTTTTKPPEPCKNWVIPHEIDKGHST
ncbi:MAG: hypothetical protein GY696_35765 [Gammaproteobacteria bacterium]|nr:hypothetical protein [Gammaproteobacteria bacterium]